jgi:hypothetical protein
VSATIAAAPASTAASSSALPQLRIVDVHFHPDPRWDAASLARVLDQTGVTSAGGGGFGPDGVLVAFGSSVPGGRVFAFAGQTEILLATDRHGERAWTVQEPEVVSYLGSLERTLQAGSHRGIGELFVNNVNTNGTPFAASRYPADSPLMQRLWALSSRFGVPLSVHMEAEAASVAGMERLLASDRKGTWLWAHCGFAGPDVIRPLLEKHPNLLCELAFREERRKPKEPIERAGNWVPEWRELIERLPDRFMLGTDTHSRDPKVYTDSIRFWRNLLTQLSPRTRRLVAHENAERLLRIAPPR